jgi:hypothetical protein
LLVQWCTQILTSSQNISSFFAYVSMCPDCIHSIFKKSGQIYADILLEILWTRFTTRNDYNLERMEYYSKVGTQNINVYNIPIINVYNIPILGAQN